MCVCTRVVYACCVRARVRPCSGTQTAPAPVRCSPGIHRPLQPPPPVRLSTRKVKCGRVCQDAKRIKMLHLSPCLGASTAHPTSTSSASPPAVAPAAAAGPRSHRRCGLPTHTLPSAPRHAGRSARLQVCRSVQGGGEEGAAAGGQQQASTPLVPAAAAPPQHQQGEEEEEDVVEVRACVCACVPACVRLRTCVAASAGTHALTRAHTRACAPRRRGSKG